MSDIVKTGGKDAPAMDTFNRGASDLASIQRSLDQRDRLAREQNENAETGGPVRRE